MSPRCHNQCVGSDGCLVDDVYTRLRTVEAELAVAVRLLEEWMATKHRHLLIEAPEHDPTDCLNCETQMFLKRTAPSDAPTEEK